MNHKTYTLLGDPMPLARARFGNGCVYDSQKTAKLVIGIELQNQHDGLPILEGPLALDIIFFMAIPKTKLKKIKPGSPHTCKPDASNLLKFYEDVATSILFNDDAQISHITIKKIYDTNPRTEFKVYQI